MENSVKYLKENKVIIFPAETLHGFSCSFYSKEAIDRIFKIKRREYGKQFIVLVKSFDMAKKIADIEYYKLEFLKKYDYWPNHLTIIFKSKLLEYKTLALRYSNSKYIMELFNYIDFPIVSTSVNYSDLPAMTNIEDIIKEFDTQVNYINITTPDSIGKASTIIDFTNDNIKLIREGEVPFNKIKEDFNEFRNNNK